MKRTFIACFLLSVVITTIQAEEKADPKKEPVPKGTSGMLTEVSEKEIVVWVSTGNGEVGISYGIHIPLTKETKYFLDEIESTGKKDDKGNEITKTIRKEITLKDLKTKQGATVIRDEKGNALSVTQTLDKRPASDKITPAPIKK